MTRGLAASKLDSGGADNLRNGGRRSSWWPWKSVAKLPVESA